MCNNKKYPLSLNGDTFNAFKSDFDQMLRKLLLEMEKWDSEEATINMKMVVTLSKDQERDFECNGYDGMKDIIKPSFKHEIGTVLQVKDKKSGSLGGNMKMVWDRENGVYVMQDIDNGQTTLFDESGDPVEQPPKPEMPQLPAGVIDADYEPVEEGNGEEASENTKSDEEASGGDNEVHEPPAFDYIRKYAGQELRCVEAMGNYTVRDINNHVVLSSAFSVNDTFYCFSEVLARHENHELVCVAYDREGFPVQDGEVARVSIECKDCGEVVFEMDNPAMNEHMDDYGYEDPDDTESQRAAG